MDRSRFAEYPRLLERASRLRDAPEASSIPGSDGAPAESAEPGPPKAGGAARAAIGAERAPIADLARDVLRRLDAGPDAPARVALFGPTGVGKSKVFNSILGTDASPSGFRRPFTRATCHYVHVDRAHVGRQIRGRLLEHSDATWRDVLLTDTPDFDSVEESHRVEADRVLLESDAFIFVTDLQKYADESTWEYLDRIVETGKPCRVVLNKSRGETAYADLARRLNERFGTDVRRMILGPAIPELPIDDATLLPGDTEAVVRLRSFIAEESSDARSVVRAGFESAFDLLHAGVDRDLKRTGGFVERRDVLLSRLAARHESAKSRMRSAVQTNVDAGARAEVYKRFQERLERIDLLRYPRRILAMPWEGMKLLYDRIRGKDGSESEGDVPTETPISALESYQSLERELIRLSQEVGEDLRSSADLGTLYDRETAARTSLSHEEIRTLYRQRMDGLREWIAREASSAAEDLSAQNKVKFVASQVLFNAVLIGIQVKTAGMFTMAELATDGVVSPLVAKAVGMALSSENVRAFEARAHDEHHRVVSEIIDIAHERYRRFVSEATPGLDDRHGVLTALAPFARQRADLVTAFSSGTLVPVSDAPVAGGPGGEPPVAESGARRPDGGVS